MSKASNLKLVALEVSSSFTPDEIKGFKDFEAFWAAVDVQNAYEETWEETKQSWKPYYLECFKRIRK